MKDRQPGQPWDYATAAEFTGLSIKTLGRMAKNKQLPVVRVGRRVLIPDAAIRKLVNGEGK